MPLGDLLPRFGDHVVPVSRFHWSAAAAEHHSTNELIAADFVEIHDANLKVGFSNLLPLDVKDERLVVDGIQCSHLDVGLLFLYSRGAVGQPDLHVRV